MNVLKKILFIIFSFVSIHSFSQENKKETISSPLVDIDTSKHIITNSVLKKDSTKKVHDPRLATRRSLIIPGWGQAYNKEYWKIPLVYGALAVPAYTYFFNKKYYGITQFAYSALYQAKYGTTGVLGSATAADSANLYKIDPEIKDAVLQGRLDLAGLQSARNYYRKNEDYSILWFVIIWGINVVDATVFGHLKNFDVSNDLSLHVEPGYNPVLKAPQIGLTLSLKNQPKKLFDTSR